MRFLSDMLYPLDGAAVGALLKNANVSSDLCYGSGPKGYVWAITKSRVEDSLPELKRPDISVESFFSNVLCNDIFQSG